MSILRSEPLWLVASSQDVAGPLIMNATPEACKPMGMDPKGLSTPNPSRLTWCSISWLATLPEAHRLELDDLWGLFQPWPFYDSIMMILLPSK